MYIGILFSFALILVIFAGFSRNSVTEQKEGLQSDVASLSKQNTELKTENTSLKAQIDKLLAQNEERAKSDATFQNAETVLAQAYEDFNSGKRTQARDAVSALDRLSLTESQKIIYDKIMK